MRIDHLGIAGEEDALAAEQRAGLSDDGKPEGPFLARAQRALLWARFWTWPNLPNAGAVADMRVSLKRGNRGKPSVDFFALVRDRLKLSRKQLYALEHDTLDVLVRVWLEDHPREVAAFVASMSGRFATAPNMQNLPRKRRK